MTAVRARHAVVPVVLPVVVLAAFCACGRRPPPEVGFASAAANERLRPDYLAQVARKAGLPRYVARLEYRDEREFRALLPEGRQPRNLPAMATVPDDLADRPPWRRGHVSRIVVLPAAFDRTQVESETIFLLGLIDHEFHHARLVYEGFAAPSLAPARFESLAPRTARLLFDVASELEAYRHERVAARRYRLPPSYRTQAAGAYLSHYLRLFDRDLPLPDETRHALLVAMFEDWMPGQAVLKREAQGWRFEVEGRRYEFPPAVVAALRRHVDDAGVP